MKAVIFDLGHVVNRWNPARAVAPLFDGDEEAALGALHDAGFHEWNRLQDGGRPWDEGLAAAPNPEARRLFQAYFDNIDIAHSELIADAVEIIGELKARGVPLYALTNAPVEAVTVGQRQHPVMAHFSDIIISGAEKVLKPDPAIFHITLKRAGYGADEVFFIDDSAGNVEGARQVGIDAHHFRGGDGLRAALVERGFL